MESTSKQIDVRYKDHVSDIIIARFHLLIPIGIFLHILFSLIDHISYSTQADLFLKIRIVDSIIALTLYVLSYSKLMRHHIVWLLNISGTVLVFGMAIMVYLSDGSASRYYEGANLVFLVFGIINSFYYKHNLLAFIVQLGAFELAMVLNGNPLNNINFAFANYFMGSTALFVVLMTKFYSEQHYKAFITQEQLRLNESKLASLFTTADKLSKTDELTRIHNRRYFFEMLSDKIKNCEASGGWFYLVIFDIDHFKKVNDTYGHTFGDTVLISIAQAVKNSIRSDDFLGRFGGDEFILCMHQISREALTIRLKKISDSINQLNLEYDNKTVTVSASFGASRFIPGIHLTEEKLMEIADAELLNVKKTARGNISINS